VRLHLDALILLHRVWGGFAAISSASLGVLAVGAEVALVQAGSVGRAEQGAVWVLAACAALMGAAAIVALVSARGLQRRQTGGRRAALVLAVPNLIVVPFGTALGVYTFWVLLNNDARLEFGRPTRGSAPAR
jgi:hypothetical protein